MKTITIYPLRDYVKISISHVTKKFDGENNYMLHDAKFYNLLTGKRIKLGSFNIAEHQFLQVKRDRCDNNHPIYLTLTKDHIQYMFNGISFKLLCITSLATTVSHPKNKRTTKNVFMPL